MARGKFLKYLIKEMSGTSMATGGQIALSKQPGYSNIITKEEEDRIKQMLDSPSNYDGLVQSLHNNKTNHHKIGNARFQ